MAKGGSVSAAEGLEWQEVAGEYWRSASTAECGGGAVLRIQTKLHRWASTEPDRRFDDLFNLIIDPAVLAVAWQRVRRNRGARTAGVDGQTAHYLEDVRGVEEFLTDLREQLKSRRFTPLPVRERMIPKAGRVRWSV